MWAGHGHSALQTVDKVQRTARATGTVLVPAQNSPTIVILALRLSAVVTGAVG